MQVRLWDIAAPEDPLLNVWSQHSEFAVGVDWDVLQVWRFAASGCITVVLHCDTLQSVLTGAKFRRPHMTYAIMM